ncbi:MAG TPA: hypothetical protein VK174_11905, partial [Chitinophagales bacterium]|nr:hypothetical protein [Chitinophagales bacterium]
ARLYVNREEGFFGTGLRKDEFVVECSDLDDIIAFTRSGKMMISRIGDKKFVGKDIIHIAVWKKNDERTAYNMMYYDGGSKRAFAKRFNVTGVTRDKEYDLTQGQAGTKVLYFTANQNSESETVRVQLHPNSTARIKEFEFDFGTIEIKGRGSVGNIVTKFPVRKVDQLERGQSSIGGVKIWLDEKFGRLVSEEKEKAVYLGEFNTGDQVIVAYKDGNIELTNFELTNKYEMDDILTVEKFDPERIYSAVYYDGNNKEYYVKRFKVELKTEKLKSSIVTEHNNSKLHVFSGRDEVQVKFNVVKGKAKEKVEETATLSKLIDVKGWKALGNRLSTFDVTGKINEIVPEVKLDKKTTEVKMGTTIELNVNPKAGKKGNQGDLF